MEEKYKSKQANGKTNENDEDDDSSSDETEDDDGFLATEELDAQISATLQAIKNKDPRLYDGKSTFYTPIDEDPSVQSTASKEKKAKPVFLQDYHRERLMRGDIGADDQEEVEEEAARPQTYAEEQDDLKKSLQNEIQAQLRAAGGDEESDGDDDFLKAKEGTKAALSGRVHPSRATKIKVPIPDVKEADKDPELFLSNFLASRAWAQGDGNGWQPFESDEDEDEKADEWEAAYNMRFEDPSKSNEVLRSYARDVTASMSVRREEKTGRKRQRELEKERKEAEKKQNKEERARLRRLKLEEAESKLQKIKKAAGLRGQALKDEEWQKLLESAWENDEWEKEMNHFFNDEYYAEADEVSDDEDDVKGSKKKPKKPKWDDDIDIKDLVSNSDDEERPKFTLTDDEAAEEGAEEDDEDAPAVKRQKTSTKERKKERLASQKEARKERAKLEALVDAHMSLENPEILSGATSTKNTGPSKFGYIETKPESFGLTTRDILMASDADLNNFVGLKKLAHWRDQEKQSKDRKRLGKKARLRQWRKETFGPEFEREPPALNFGRFEKEKTAVDDEDGGNIIEGSKKKRKRSRPNKGKDKETSVVE